MISLGDIGQINIPLKNGILELSVKQVLFKGQLRPFIMRKLRLGTTDELTHTEVYTCITSKQELSDWIVKDEYSSIHPEYFKQLELLCISNLP